MTPVWLKPVTSRSRDKQSTTEPLRSHPINLISADVVSYLVCITVGPVHIRMHAIPSQIKIYNNNNKDKKQHKPAKHLQPRN